MWKGLKQTLSTRPFLWIILIVFTKTFGFGLVATLGFYVNAYYVCQGDIAKATQVMGVIGSVLFIPNVLAIPICTWMANRWDKSVVLYFTVITGILGSLSVYFCMTPQNPWLQIIHYFLIGPVGIGLWLVVPSMQADVADYDELMTGRRREGSFSAVFSWTFKASTAVTGGLGGFLIVWTGFKIENGYLQQPGCLRICVFFTFGSLSVSWPSAFSRSVDTD